MTLQYSPLAKMLHWLIAGMIVLQFVLAKLADLAGDGDQPLRELALLANHKSVGITVLVLAAVRLAWRFRNPPPAHPSTMPRWQVTAAQVSHWSFYLLLFAMPVSGWLMSSATAYSVSWFNVLQLPDLIAPHEELAERFEEVHELLARILILVAGLHTAAAIKHAVIDKDGTLNRIVSASSITAFAVVIAWGTMSLGGNDVGSGNASAVTPAAPQSANSAAIEAKNQSDLPVWKIDYSASHIRFIGEQAGAEFEGTWDSWLADIRFDAGNLSSSSFDVAVDTGSGNTQDVERDSTLTEPEWFDTANFPYAYFRASEFVMAKDEYVASGYLFIKDVPSPVTFTFSVEVAGDRRILTGTAQLDRLALGLGTGEWDDTQWVGRSVSVEVRVAARSSH